MHKTFFLFLLVGIATGSLNAFADVDTTGEKCRRDITFASLPPEDQAKLNRGELILRAEKDSNGYIMGYILKTTKYDPELVFSLYARVEHHAGNNGLGDFIRKSELRPSPPGSPVNLVRVFYEQHVTLLGNGQYVIEDLLTRRDGGYELNGKLVEASDASFSPRWFDGHFYSVPWGNGGAFVVACHYMVPRSSWFKGKFNDTALERLEKTAANLTRWMERVASNKALETEYREALRAHLLPLTSATPAASAEDTKSISSSAVKKH